MLAVNSENENEDENEDGAIIDENENDRDDESVDLLYFNLFCYIASVYAFMGLNA